MTIALPVPYVIAWSDEAVRQRLVFEIHQRTCTLRLAYANPRETDWVDGVLRARVRVHRGGDPQWRLLNTRRQWHCMRNGLCQVCGRPATDADGRIPWVITETAFQATSEDGGLTNAPATCRACMGQALALCPQLRKSAAIYTAARAVPAGVLGTVFEPGPYMKAIPVPGAHNVFIGLEEKRRLSKVLATQLVVRLEDLRREE